VTTPLPEGTGFPAGRRLRGTATYLHCLRQSYRDRRRYGTCITATSTVQDAGISDGRVSLGAGPLSKGILFPVAALYRISPAQILRAVASRNQRGIEVGKLC